VTLVALAQIGEFVGGIAVEFETALVVLASREVIDDAEGENKP